MKTTVGNILFNESLPKSMRDYSRIVTGRNIGGILTELAKKYPEHYPEAVFNIKKLGDDTAYYTAHSVKLADFEPPKEKEQIIKDTLTRLNKALAESKTDSDYEKKFAQIVGKNKTKLEKAVVEKGLKDKSGLAEMVLSKSRGSPDQLNSIVGSPMAVQDSMNRTITVPIINSYSEGLDPSEYWAASYGTRKGVLATKLSTAEGGYFGKRLAGPVQRLIITENDCGTYNGISENLDGDILETFLARDAGPYKHNDLVTPDVIDNLKKLNIDKVIIRSPLTCESEDGICAKCRGIIETGKEPTIGTNVGVNSALTISEPVAQGALNVKHKGGALEEKHLIDIDLNTLKRLVDIPKTFPDAAVLAEESGKVTRIKEAPQGGKLVYVGDEEHYVPQKRSLKVSEGDSVNKGDVLTDGIINPSDVVRLKGIGPARLFFAKYYKDLYKQAYGKDIHQKHFEMFARGIINYVNVDRTDESEGLLPGDKISVQKANKLFKPDKSFAKKPSEAIGLWLAKPALHYTIGAEVTKEMAEDLKDAGVSSVLVTDKEPGFSPVMIRLNAVADADPDWMRRLGGERLRASLLKSVQKGEESDIHGTSYIPGLAYGAEFGNINEKGKY